MKTKNGTTTPTQKQIESLIAEVTALGKRVEAFTVTLSSAERVAALKMRAGGEPVVASIAQLVEQHGLAMPDLSVDGMNAALVLARRIQPLVEAVQQLERRLDDTVLASTSDCWKAATAYYSALVRSAANNPTLEASLRPIVAFFSQGPRKKTPANGTPSKPPVPSAA